MHLTKAELRRTLKQARLALPLEARQAKSTAIASGLWQAVDWSSVTTVHCFEPIERFGEVDLRDFLAALQDEYPSVQLFTSRQIGDEWRVVSAVDGGPASASLMFDIIIVPMLGFDDSLQRIGYGGGYYDRFLVAQSQAHKIGVCFAVGHLDDMPTDPHDVALDLLLTETEIYTL